MHSAWVDLLAVNPLGQLQINPGTIKRVVVAGRVFKTDGTQPKDEVDCYSTMF